MAKTDEVGYSSVLYAYDVRRSAKSLFTGDLHVNVHVHPPNEWFSANLTAMEAAIAGAMVKGDLPDWEN